jgi:hypothetical protein
MMSNESAVLQAKINANFVVYMDQTNCCLHGPENTALPGQSMHLSTVGIMSQRNIYKIASSDASQKKDPVGST